MIFYIPYQNHLHNNIYTEYLDMNKHQIYHLSDIYILLMIVFRDIFVTSLRILMQSKGRDMLTSNLAKYKTTIQIMMIVILFLNPYFYNWNQDVLYYLTLLFPR